MPDNAEQPFFAHSLSVCSLVSRIWAGRFAFFCLGVGLGIRVSLIPYAKIRLGINDAELGFLLLFLGIGAIIPMPVTGKLVNRLGCRVMQNIFTPVFCFSLLLASFVTDSILLTLSVFLMGLSSGILDVVIKVQTALLENLSKRRYMANFHGMRMVGITAGTGGMAFFLQLTQADKNQEPLSATLILCLAMLLATLYFQFSFFPRTEQTAEQSNCSQERKNTENNIPHKKRTGIFSPISLSALCRNTLFWLGIVVFFSYMISGTLMDWSALFMHEIRHIPLAQANFGYTIFAVTMTVGRFLGDWLGTRFGARSVLLYGMIFCIVGFTAMGFVSQVWLTYCLFFLLGFFSANISPMLFYLASKNAGADLGSSIAKVTSLGFISLLAGPAIMGFVAHQFGMVWIFYTLALFLSIALVILWRLQVKE